jgi:hypothetical protein
MGSGEPVSCGHDRLDGMGLGEFAYLTILILI